jgi:segregation and condensation protein B
VDKSDPEQGISLDELTEAFAEVMAAGAGTEPLLPDGETATPPTEGLPAEQPAESLAPGEEASGGEDGACEICPRSILEAMLFVGNRDDRPLSATRAAELLRGVQPEEIPALVDELNQRYLANGCPYCISHDGSGYRLVLRGVYHRLRNRLYGRIREARLSQAAVDVLAIVAYQQPLSGEQVSRLRGKPSSQVLRQLVRRGLLRLERREPQRQKPSYFTTDRFLRLFGMKSLEDLPRSEELDRP